MEAKCGAVRTTYGYQEIDRSNVCQIAQRLGKTTVHITGTKFGWRTAEDAYM